VHIGIKRMPVNCAVQSRKLMPEMIARAKTSHDKYWQKQDKKAKNR